MNLSQTNEDIIPIKSGQLTIPAKLRELFPWLNQDSLIQAKPTSQGLLLQPVQKPKARINTKKAIDTNKLLKKLRELAKHDKPIMSAVEFLRIDRQSH